MVSKIFFVVFHIPLSLQLQFGPSMAGAWIRASYYWHSAKEFPVSDLNSNLFTHLICGYAGISSTSYELFFSPSNEKYLIPIFTETVKQKNPSVVTLLSIGGDEVPVSTFSSMTRNSDYRKSFIDSSIKIARLYGFEGLDLHWLYPTTSSEMFNLGVLFQERRAATELEARNSSQSRLILTAKVYYTPTRSVSYPVNAMQQYLDWVHVLSGEYTDPSSAEFTQAADALYDPSTVVNTDYGIREWIDGGLSADKLVLFLPFAGYAWTLANSKEKGIGAPSTGPAISEDGYLTYSEIKNYIKQYGRDVQVMYNATYVVNYFTIGTYSIIFNGVETIETKVLYAKEKKLRGYHVWQASYDVNWELSRAAAELDSNNSTVVQPVNSTVVQPVKDDNKNIGQNKRSLLGIVLLSTTAALVLLVGIACAMYYCWRRKLKLRGTTDSAKESNDSVNKGAAGDFNSNDPNLIEYTLADIEAATNMFSIENKLGQGGYGPVYKGILPDGRAIAVKKLSETSDQGFEEFKNEVVLTAKLQHVNLVRVLGFCIDKEEHILIYEYMPNKSLDSYLFDPIRRYILDWNKRVNIIEGITQGLLYLQEYSRLTIIHRDLKVSNILLDGELKPKISDFGTARILVKDDHEANTQHIVGTLGYTPPEYVQRGIYSTKSDVYGFGVLLLQIISGKRISCFYGVNESLSLVEYAYELWKDGKGMKFMDETLDDTYSSCKLMRCLQVALLCVQENSNDRPSMLEVFSLLKNDTTDTLIPKKPGFLKQNEEYGRNISPQQLESGAVSSCKDITVSEVVAR